MLPSRLIAALFLSSSLLPAQSIDASKVGPEFGERSRRVATHAVSCSKDEKIRSFHPQLGCVDLVSHVSSSVVQA